MTAAFLLRYLDLQHCRQVKELERWLSCKEQFAVEDCRSGPTCRSAKVTTDTFFWPPFTPGPYIVKLHIIKTIDFIFKLIGHWKCGWLKSKCYE